MTSSARPAHDRERADRRREGLDSPVEGFNERARRAIADDSLHDAIALTTERLTAGRDAALGALPQAPSLRERAYRIKQRTMADLDRYLRGADESDVDPCRPARPPPEALTTPIELESGAHRAERGMQSAGFRELDFQIDREIFGRSSAVVPRYSADRTASELVVRKVRELYPEWNQDVVEDQWGYIASWRCPGRPSGLVLLAQHRAAVITVAVCRASLLAVRNMRSYELRREKRMGAIPVPAQPAPRRQRQRSG